MTCGDPILADWAVFLHACRRVIGTEGDVKKPPWKPKDIEIYNVVVVDQEKSIFYHKGAIRMQMTDIQQCVANVQATTAEGNPAQLDDVPVWESDDTNVVLVEPAPDGMSCVIKSPSPGPLGSAVVTVSAKINGQDVFATLAVDIVASAATKLEINTQPPTP